MKQPLYKQIASTLQALENCRKSNNTEWIEKHSARLDSLLDELPQGSGIDSDITLLDNSTPEKLLISFSYHHMSEFGYYDGWTDHVVKVIPSLAHDFTLSISGRNRNDIKEYLAEVFESALSQEVE